MNSMTRRGLLTSVATFPLFLAGCAQQAPIVPGPGTPPSSKIAEILQYVGPLVDAFVNTLYPLASRYVSAETLVEVGKWIEVLKVGAAQLGSGSFSSLGDITSTILGASKSVIVLLRQQGVNLPSTLDVVLTAAEVVLPIIANLAGLFLAPAPTRSRMVRMTPEQAVSVLRTAGGRRIV